MRILLDTNALLWMLDDDAKFGPTAREAVLDAESVAVSVATLWEIAIKVSLKKLGAVPELYDVIQTSGLQRLNIADSHLQRLENLPFLHRDPFDRLLIAQAQAEGMAVLTSDESFRQYDVRRLDVTR